MPQYNNEFNEDVKALIEFGRAEGNGQIWLDSSDTTQRRLINNRDLWELISISLPEGDLCRLIKGLVRYDKLLDGNGYGLGGSVAPGIILCKRYALRFSEKEEELMSWVVDNRVNPYLPFGSIINNHCKSFREYAEDSRKRDVESNKRKDIENKLQEERRKVKEEKDLANAKINLPNAVRRGDIKAVIALVEKGIDVSLFVHNGKSIFEYAEECGNKVIIDYLNRCMSQ